MSRVTNNSFDVKYAPKSLDEVVLENDRVQRDLQRYVDGDIGKPLILYGPYGTGKSTIAAQLSRAIAHRYNNESLFDERSVTFTPVTYRTDAALVRAIEDYISYRRFIVIFDELDQMPARVVKNMKIHIDKRGDNILFVATTNNLMGLEGGHKDRSNCLHIRPAPLDRWKPRIEKILEAEGVPVPDDKELENMLNLSKGGHRQFLSELQRYTEDVRGQVAAE